MMDLKTHKTWANSGTGSDDDVKMLLEDLDSGAADDSTTKLALSLEADASTMVMMMLLPGVNGVDPASHAATTYSEEEQREQLGVSDEQESPDFNDDDDFDEELWTSAANVPFDLIDADQAPLSLNDEGENDLLAAREVEDAAMAASTPVMAMGQLLGVAIAPFTETLDTALTTAAAAATGAAAKKRRGRKPLPKAKKETKKPKRPPPSPTKARLRNYERRSRTKREVRMCMCCYVAYNNCILIVVVYVVCCMLYVVAHDAVDEGRGRDA